MVIQEMIEASVLNTGDTPTQIYNHAQKTDSAHECCIIHTDTTGPDCVQYPGVELGLIAHAVCAVILGVY
jgi:hypothetical protein